MQDVKTKKVVADHLFVTKVDRFTRNLYATKDIVETLNKYGVTVHSLEQGDMDYTNSNNFLSTALPTLLAHHDNIVRSEGVKRGMRQAMKNGHYIAKPPKGYTKNKETNLMIIDTPKTLCNGHFISTQKVFTAQKKLE